MILGVGSCGDKIMGIEGVKEPSSGHWRIIHVDIESELKSVLQ